MSLNVKSLLNNKIDKKYNDQVFWYASEVIIKHDTIKIYVNQNNLFTFDNIDLDLIKISQLANIKQTNTNNMKNVLISSGSFLFINDKLAVTQRSLDTQFDPGFWTTPAGRCDRAVFETGIKETIEEIEVLKNSKQIYPDISKDIIKNSNHTEFYKTSFKCNKYPLKTYNVELYLEGKLIEKSKAWFYFSSSVNTLEFRIPLFTNLHESEIELNNPEYHTDTGLKTIDELKNVNTVPALKQLLCEINNV